MTMHCRPEAQPEHRDPVDPGVVDRADLALDAAHPEAAGNQHALHVAQRGGRRRRRSGSRRRRPRRVSTLALLREPAGAQRLGHRQVGVRQVDVLADDRDPHRLGRVVHPVQQLTPHRPVDVVEAQVQPAHHVGVQALAVQHPRDVVDRRRVRGGDHRLGVDVAHQRDLALERLGDLPVGAADQRVGLDADVAQRGDRVLGRLGLELAGRRQVRHQRDVQEEDVVPADLVPDLPGRLQERQRLDVADRPADLGDHHVRRFPVGIGVGHRPDPVLDLVGDVRDDLHGVAQVFAAPFPGDHP